MDYMKEKDVKFNNERKTFSKKFKREILLEFIKGENIKNKLLEAAQEKTKDKKYASKLLHKWKKEFHLNPEAMLLLNHEIDIKMVENEVNSLGLDNEEEIDIEVALRELKNKFLKIIQ